MIIATKNWKPVILPLTGVGNLRKPVSPTSFGEDLEKRLVNAGLATYVEEPTAAPAPAPVEVAEAAAPAPTPVEVAEAAAPAPTSEPQETVAEAEEEETPTEDAGASKKPRRATKKSTDDAGG